MAVYKIYPSKDTTIYSRFTCKNAGIDEILEISSKNSLDYLRYYDKKDSFIEKSPYFNYDFPFLENFQEVPEEPIEDIRRSLIKFSESDVNFLKTLNSSSYSASLRLSLAFAQNLSTEYSIKCLPLVQAWDMGTGRFSDTPENRTGAGWKFAGACNQSFTWNDQIGDTLYKEVVGGGVWDESLGQVQSFIYTDNKDININITPIVNYWFDNETFNKGVILKHADDVELNSSSYMDLKFFSNETHTIYGPHLDFKWDDSVYNVPVSASVTSKYIINNEFIINFENNRGKFKKDSQYTFRVKAKDKYPTRQFTTSSVYLNWKYMMEGSQWSIVDEKTNDVIIDFDSQYTKISADQNGNFFKVFMKGFHPERYYKILIKAKRLVTSEGVLSSYGSDSEIYQALSLLSDEDINALPSEYVTIDEDIIFKIEN